MTENVLAFDHLRQLEKLKAIVGGIDECKRLGFVHVDEQDVTSLSTAGLAFLIYVVARDVTTLAEAFAAGRAATFDEIDPLKCFPDAPERG